MVKGTVTNAGGYETGVTVNGIVASLYDNQFVAGHVPLVSGTNILTVTANDSGGNSASASITVNAVTTGNYIRLTADTESGIAPLETTLRIDGSFSIDNSTITVTGPAQPEFLSSSATEYKIRMTVEGIYYFTATVTGPDNDQYQDTAAATVMSMIATDTLLRGLWTSMTNSLLNGDTATALTFILPASRASYQQMFDLLSDQLPSITATQTELNFISMRDGQAKYELVTSENGTPYSYEVIFESDSNGLWLIKEF